MTTSSSPRDAVYRALRFQESETCPYYAWIDAGIVQRLIDHYGPDQFIGHGAGAKTLASSHTVMNEIRALPVEEHNDYFVDEYGVTYRRGSALHVEKPALSKPSLTGYSFPDLTTAAHFADIGPWSQANSHRFKIVQLGMMFFERSWGMRGMENILMDLCLEQTFAHDLFAGLESVISDALDRLLALHGDHIDAIGLSDDCGSETSLLIAPQQWRAFIKPALKRIFTRIHAAGKVTYLHSCGNVTEIIPDLIDIGLDMLQPIQPEAMDIFAIKRNFGKDLTLVGGISTQKTLPYGTSQDVRREVRACLTQMAAGGGYIMAPAKPIMPGVPLENACALIDSFQNQPACLAQPE